MANQAYHDKIAGFKKTCADAQECLPKGTQIEFIDETDDYGLLVRIDGFEFLLTSEECKQVRKTLLGEQYRTYESWRAEVYNEYGEETDTEIEEIRGLHNILCECYLWTVRHIFDNNTQDQAQYEDWKISRTIRCEW